VNRWIEELVGADFGDIRLSARLVRLVEQFSERPEGGVLEACGSASAAKAAYRFWSNESVTPAGILCSHVEQTTRRASAFPVVLVAQDTTEIHLTSHTATTGLGYLGSARCRGIMLHNLLCLSPEGVPLGMLGQRFWARDVADLGKRVRRNSKPVEQKESQRWLDGLATVEQQLAGHPSVVLIGDRESDLYDLFAQRRSAGVELLVRVCRRERCVDHPARYLGHAVAESPPRAEMTIRVPRADDRPERTAVLTLRWCQLTIREPANYLGVPAVQPVQLYFLLAREDYPPAGQKRLEWLLATTVSIETFEDAQRVLQWYRCRWMIERFHFVLKSGCGIEQRCLETAERMENLIATFSLVAWRLLWLTCEARRTPDEDCTVILDQDQWRVLHLAKHRGTAPPTHCPSLRQAVIDIAKLGGFLGRRGDGQPGVKTLWRGWRRLTDLVRGYQLATGRTTDSIEDYG
jgi:Transposase DNA-binding/Transposase Tn5 dimerisation domain